MGVVLDSNCLMPEQSQHEREQNSGVIGDQTSLSLKGMAFNIRRSKAMGPERFPGLN